MRDENDGTETPTGWFEDAKIPKIESPDKRVLSIIRRHAEAVR